MKSESNRHTPPHCFCALPTILRADCYGTVYKCQANNLNPPPTDNSRADIDRDISSNSSRFLAGSHLASTSTQPGSPRRVASMRKESKPPDRPSPATIAAIQDIASVLSSFGKTLAPRYPGLVKNGLKDSANNASGSNCDSSGDHTIRNHTHQQQQQQQQQPSNPMLPPPSSKPRPMGVCGFHVHTSTWEKFKFQLLQAESMTAGGGGPLGRSQGSEREKVFAEGHHQLVLRHRCLHDGFIQLAREDGCKAQMTTVAQWTAWEQEIVERSSPWSGGAIAAPSCFCGHQMRLSYLYNGQGPLMSYVCALRSKDVQRGCSRVVSSATWAVRKKPTPGHILSLQARLFSAKAQPRRDDSGQLTYVDNGLAVSRQAANGSGNVFDSQETLSTAALASALDHKLQTNNDPSRESRQDSGIEVDENDPEGDDEDEGSEPDWSQSTTWCLNASPRHRMRPLSLSTSLLRKGDWSGDLKARRWNEPQEGGRNDAYNHRNENCDYSHQDHQRRICDNNGKTDLSMRPIPTGPTADVRSLSVSQMRGMYLSLETPKEYGTLIQRLHGSKMLAAERERGAKAVQGSETRLRDWEDSIERLGKYVKELCQDGLDSSTLLCRSCGNGTLLHANVPCYHLVMCDECIKKYQCCVVCSTKIESSQRIYW